MMHNSNNCFSKPDMTSEQVKMCTTCKHASSPPNWCCKWGLRIGKRSGKIIYRQSVPTITSMANHFSKAMVKWAKKGFKCVSKEEYMKRRNICHECTPNGRCPHCGCSLWAKVALATEKCPEGKW